MDEQQEPVKVAVVNYGIGNVGSVKRYFYRLGCDAQILEPSDDWGGRDIVVVPGIGNFDELMRRVRKTDSRTKLLDVIANPEVAYIGICLGFQILAEDSREGSEKGLGVIPGTVLSFAEQGIDYAVPHMGWNLAQFESERFEDEFFYFVHSFYLDIDTDSRFAKTEYGISFCSAVHQPQLWGLQFHPEKSGTNGLAFGRELLDVVQEEKNSGSTYLESQTCQDGSI